MRLVRVAAAALIALSACSSGRGAPTLPYQDERLPFEARVKDLVGRMTLDEKVAQMQDAAPAIPRLGVPAYNWWNEALHGVARSGLATVFPQAIGLAAAWDEPLMFRVATAISDEARAKHQEYLRKGLHRRYEGLTFWSPNINIFRDPRWGRGQETYGEDPFLAGRLAVHFIRGMQGDDPKYFKTIATVKHFAVHSGPEPDRHTFNAVIGERDLRETYLAQFAAGIQEGRADSVMCAYNAVDGPPACASDALLGGILRGDWGFKGYVVSDCGAIDDIYQHHKTVKTAPEAAAIAVKGGTDLSCGHAYKNLVQAVKAGLIGEAPIDAAVSRLFLARFKLGEFDAPAHVKWAQTPYTDLDSPAHRQLALDAAHESIVLLKNDKGTLPLDKQRLRTVAVIGPNADEREMLLGNYNGEPADPITPLRGIREALPGARVIYARGADPADRVPAVDVVPATALRTRSGAPGLDVAYFGSHELKGPPRDTGVDRTVDAIWGEGAPRAGMNTDDFGVRWSGTIAAPRAGSYTFGIASSMKFTLWLDGREILKNDEDSEPGLAQAPAMTLEAGRPHAIRIDAEETYGDARLQLVWAAPHDPYDVDAVRAAQQADAVVLVLGLTPSLEGEEMSIDVPGFSGGDRTSLDLPAPQEALLEKIVALGKPTVLVLLNGSALAVDWAQAHVPAIVEAWYPGQAAGTAIAHVLFGDYNPAGRLPVTFYRSVEDLPPFDDYDMKGRTYRFFKGAPLYPFGYGLSYTTFSYSNLRTSAQHLANGETITVSVDVTNTGSRAGDEVVQLYVRHLGSAVDRPIEDLRGFARVSIAPGQTKTAQMALPASALAYWNAARHAWVVETEPVRLVVGGSSADARLAHTVQVTGGG